MTDLERIVLLFQTCGALLAVSSALIVVAPALTEGLLSRVGRYGGTSELRAVRVQVIGLSGATTCFFLGTIVGLIGMFWPSRVILLSIVGLTGLGMTALAVGGAVVCAKTAALARGDNS